jgi:hypothetical protein
MVESRAFVGNVMQFADIFGVGNVMTVAAMFEALGVGNVMQVALPPIIFPSDPESGRRDEAL